MSSSAIKHLNIKRNDQPILKPYRFNFNYDLFETYFEIKDLKDLRNASIKELKLYVPLIYTSKMRFKTKELLNNPNIKKIKLTIADCNKSIIFISKLLKQNSSIKEIKLDFEYINKSNHITKLTWYYFINTVSSRLVNIEYIRFSVDNTDIMNELFKNSNLTGINQYYEEEGEDLDFIISILSTKKYLNKFLINKDVIDINQKIFDCISKSKSNAEINTLYLYLFDNNRRLEFVDKAYLLKTETIFIDNIDEHDYNEIIDHILKLSSNHLNTVKRILLHQHGCYNCIDELKFIDIFSSVINSNNYDIQKIPKIFVNNYREIRIIQNKNEFDDSTKYICSYANITNMQNIPEIIANNGHLQDDNIKNVILIFKDNMLNEYVYTQFLYILFNCPETLSILSLNYDEDDIKLGIMNPKLIIENTPIIINQIRAVFNSFKENYIHFPSSEIYYLEFFFNSNHPELNVFYYTILDIMLQMRIKINILVLKNGSFIDLVNFFERHITDKCLNINNIELIVSEIDKDNLDRLYQYSHLIEETISVKFSDEINLTPERKLEEYISINSRPINYTNFIYFPEINSRSDIHLKDNSAITSCIENCRNIIKRTNAKLNINLYLDLKNLSLETLHILFSFFKEFQYQLDDIKLINSFEANDKDVARKIVFLYLETIIDSLFREKEIYCFQRISLCELIYGINNSFLHKKSKRYNKLHNILVNIRKKIN